MAIDRLIEKIIEKKNPCIAGIDPEWDKIPECYKNHAVSPAEAVGEWAADVIDAVADIVPAIKPQMAFFEVYGADGLTVHEKTVRLAHERGLLAVDDCKRNDIGNTARAYAFAHLAKDGPINADFMTVSPFLGRDSMQPFIDRAESDGKGIFILVRTSNHGSGEIAGARNIRGQRVCDLLAEYINGKGLQCVGEHGYSSIGAVVGATFPHEAGRLRAAMSRSFFLVPGFGAQGGRAEDVVPCFNRDGLGAIVSSSRGILYHHLNTPDYDGSRAMYIHLVREQAAAMRNAVYDKLRASYGSMKY